jgi:hypothetical protein
VTGASTLDVLAEELEDLGPQDGAAPPAQNACPSSWVVPFGGKTWRREGFSAARISSWRTRLGAVSKSFSAWRKKTGLWDGSGVRSRRRAGGNIGFFCRART